MVYEAGFNYLITGISKNIFCLITNLDLDFVPLGTMILHKNSVIKNE
jgi:hypothetical protein